MPRTASPPPAEVVAAVLARRTSDSAQHGRARLAVGAGAMALAAHHAVLAANGASG